MITRGVFESLVAPPTCTSEFLISSYCAPLAQRAYQTLHALTAAHYVATSSMMLFYLSECSEKLEPKYFIVL